VADDTLIEKLERSIAHAGITENPGAPLNPRSLKMSSFLPALGLGLNYKKSATISHPCRGYIVAYKAVTEPAVQSIEDQMQYAASKRPSFEMFNFLYKVWIPALPGSGYNSFGPKDWKSKEKFTKLLWGQQWMPIDLSVVNVQGAPPPGSEVRVTFPAWPASLANPKITAVGPVSKEISSKIPTRQAPPTTKQAFALGSSPATMGTSPGSRGSSGDFDTPAPNNPKVDPNDQGPIKGLGAYKRGERNRNMKIIERYMKKFGVTNRYMKIALLSVIAKESGLKPKAEKGYGKASVARIKDIFGARVSKFSDAELNELKKDDRKFFSWIYGGHFPNFKQYGNRPDTDDGYDYRGRGMNQITFRTAYKNAGDRIGVDFVGNPDLLNDPEHASHAAIDFLVRRLKQPKSPVSGDINNVGSQAEANEVAARANAGWNKEGRALDRAIDSTNKASYKFE